MRMTRTHKIVITAVTTTIATASLLTFTRAEPITPDQIAAMPRSASDSPTVAGSTPTAKAEKAAKQKAKTAAKKKAQADTAKAQTPSTSSSGAASPSTPSTRPPSKPSAPVTTTPPPEPEPEPSPTPPKKKNLLEVLLGR